MRPEMLLPDSGLGRILLKLRGKYGVFDRGI